MPKVVWNPNWKVGIDSIDQQHQKLVGLVNNAYDILMLSVAERNKALEKILTELMDYTEYHFNTEEGLFKEYAYKDAVDHVQMHRFFTQKVQGLYQMLEDGRSDVILETIDFLKEWLIHHILDVDKKYAGFLISKGVK